MMQDICIENVLYVFSYQTATDSRLVDDKVYFIDFHTSRQLSLEPGRQPPILMPPSQEEKPSGMTTLDPYSFDVCCTGKLMQFMLKVGTTHDYYRMRSLMPDGTTQYTFLKESDLPWIPRRYAQWLMGNEHGCTSICHCHLTACRARQVLTVLRWLVYTSEFVSKGSGSAQHLLDVCLFFPLSTIWGAVQSVSVFSV